KLSIASAGNLTRNLTVETLEKALLKLLSLDQEKSRAKKRFIKWKGLSK
ncbi:MAG: hypothetical protein H7Y41_01400, partial [Hyphomonadaceae bacterium]|nr:hypothetical protein [Clostridia bacterium]